MLYKERTGSNPVPAIIGGVMKMNKLLKSIVREVRYRDGQDANAPISKALLANLELRIKGYLAIELGICEPQSVLDDNETAYYLSIGELKDGPSN